MGKLLKYDVDVSTHIAVATFNNPEFGNALSPDMFPEILSVLAHAANDENVWALIWTGAGKVWSAGADFSGANPDQMTPKDPRAPWTSGGYGKGIESLIGNYGWVTAFGEAFWGFQKPMIAAMNGAAAGASLAIALCCDIRVALEDAKLVPAFVQGGYPPEAGMSFLLSRIVGYGPAMDMSLTNRIVLGKEALQMGLVAQTVKTREEVLPCAKEVAMSICSLPQPAVRMTKLAMQRGLESTFQGALREEGIMGHRIVGHPLSKTMTLGGPSKISEIADKKQQARAVQK